MISWIKAIVLLAASVGAARLTYDGVTYLWASSIDRTVVVFFACAAASSTLSCFGDALANLGEALD